MEIRFPWEPRSPQPKPDLLSEEGGDERRPARGRRRLDRYKELANSDTTFLYAHLTVAGPEREVGEFERRARGPGVIPWYFDGDVLEEDIFLMAIQAPDRSLTVEGCRILAHQFRLRAEERHSQVLALVEAGNTRCPLDLHALLPVPESLLRRGLSDSRSRAWLRKQWGVETALCKVVVLPEKKNQSTKSIKNRALQYGFFSEKSLPERAVRRLTELWPALHFTLVEREAF